MVRLRLLQGLLQKPWQRQARGASLIEVIIASVVMLVALTAVVPLYTMAVKDFGTATESVDRQNRLDADYAAIRQLGEKFSWCSGNGSVNVTPSATCVYTSVGDSTYYVPNNSASAPAVGPQLASFRLACSTATATSDPLTTALVAAINNLPSPTGLTRTVSLDDGTAHRLRIEYRNSSSDSTLVGTLVYTPPIVAWCP